MNKQRRKSITDILVQVEELKSQIESLLDEEQESFDNMPESLQGSERGEACETAINALQEAVDSADCVIGALNEAMEA